MGIRTGYRNVTITDPVKAYPDGDLYEGPVSGFDFKFQKANKADIDVRLGWAGTQLETVNSSIYYASGYPGRRHHFVAVGPGVVWQRYDGYSPAGGQNYIYIKGEKWKTSDFVRKTKNQVMELFSPKHVREARGSRP